MSSYIYLFKKRVKSKPARRISTQSYSQNYLLLLSFNNMLVYKFTASVCINVYTVYKPKCVMLMAMVMMTMMAKLNGSHYALLLHTHIHP